MTRPFFSDLQELYQISKPSCHIRLGITQVGASRAFVTQLMPLTASPQDAWSEAIQAARDIYDQAGGQPLQLCLSGGIDSESMARAFLQANVPFEACILKFNDNWNEHDIQTGLDFLHAYRIPHKFVDLDVIRFLEGGEYFEYGQKYRCQSPQIATHLWLLDQLDGLPVLSGNPICPVMQDESYYWLGLPGDLHAAYFRYFQETRRAGVPWFFLQNPELSAAFLQTEVMKPFLQGQIHDRSAYGYEVKCQTYREAGFDVLPRRNKFTGFEKLRQHYDQKLNQQWGTAFDRLFRTPLENLNPFLNDYYQLVPSNYLSPPQRFGGFFERLGMRRK